MAEFPDAGKHCSVAECKQLDLLPIQCDACSRIVCKHHRMYDSHGCTESYKKNVQLPTCPLCQQSVPILRGENCDLRVNEHIERDCRSDIAKKGRMAPKCGVKGCSKRELVTMVCNDCGIHFCLGHRHPTDHQCNLLRGNASIEHRSKAQKIDAKHSESEQMDALFAQQLQQEEYERELRANNASSVGSSGRQNGNCMIS